MKVRQLCQEYTLLNEEEIQTIERTAEQLQLIADMTSTNIFIDCLVKDSLNAIVVAEASPSSGESIYNDPYVGTMVYEEFEPSVFLSFRTGKKLFFNNAVTQNGRLVHQSVVPIKNDSGVVIATLIKEELEFEDKLMTATKKNAKTSKALLWELYFGTDLGRPALSDILKEHFILVDSSLRIVYANPAAQNYFAEKFGVEGGIGKKVTKVIPFISPFIETEKDLVLKEIKVGKTFLEVRKVDIYQDDHMHGMLILLRDITDLRMKERELVLKSVAIKEIHHRVKNNLQTVASLLNLQIRRGVSNESKGYLTDSLNRVLSIASVYEIILSGDHADEDQVDIVQLSNKIASMLLQNNATDKAIELEVSNEEIIENSKKAVSIALVVNELVQNSINHAFSYRQTGYIRVQFKQQRNQIILKVRDNGSGFQNEMKSSLGLDIVKTIIEHDLTGSYTIDSSSNGTMVLVTFPKEGKDFIDDEKKNINR
ncbi:sensor histidine kinase [Sporosarcina sp. CAU 1771]